MLILPLLSDSIILFSIPVPWGSGAIEVSQLYLFSIGLGITWASMMAMPYQMLASYSDKTGVYIVFLICLLLFP